LGGVEQRWSDYGFLLFRVVHGGLDQCDDPEAEPKGKDEYGRCQVQPVARVDLDEGEPERRSGAE
jgi:hypothetical protein